MRKLFVFMLLLLSLAVSAQTDKTFMSVDWDKIKAEVEANPQHVQQLVDILINVDADTTLTAEDKILMLLLRLQIRFLPAIRLILMRLCLRFITLENLQTPNPINHGC